MNKEIKEKWITALKSGEYKQGKGTLNANEEFCCLGVLADLYLKEKNREWEIQSDGKHLIDGNSAYLSQECKLWAGLNDGNPTPLGYKLGVANLNDEGATFEEIAAIIEKGL